MVKSWVNRLQSLYPHLNITIAVGGEKIRPNRVYVAPGGKHCGITTGKTFNLFEEEREKTTSFLQLMLRLLQLQEYIKKTPLGSF